MDSLRKVAICLVGLGVGTTVLLLVVVLFRAPVNPEGAMGDIVARLGFLPVLLFAAGIVLAFFCNPRQLRKP